MADIRQGIISTAQSLGISPVDLATAISYETAGTFDPTKAGPTTQWGQHRGLIQFGEPQAKKYGVDWQNPIASQLGPDGAVAKYLRDTGVREGMGLLDIYSAINAGGVGRYGRTDANNGGAPGTVRDKVEKQMAAHRAKAEALIGSGGQPTVQGSAGDDNLGVANMATQSPAQTQAKPSFWDKFMGGALADPDKRARLAVALEGATLNPNPAVMMMAQQGIQQRAQERAMGIQDKAQEQQRNRTVEWLRSQGRDDLAGAIMTGALPASEAIKLSQQQPKDDRTAQIKNYEYWLSQGKAPEEASQLARGGQTINIGGGQAPSPFQKKVDEQFAERYLDWKTTGAVDTSRQVAQIGGVLDKLEAGEELTGPVVGAISNAGLGAIFAPDAQDARDQVESVVQRSLRETLGAQFTAAEGDRLIARAYNVNLSPEKNILRLKALYSTLQAADEAKRAMISYAEENGTLMGYKGPAIPSADEILGNMDAAAPFDAKPQAASGTPKPKRLKYNVETGEFE